MDLANRELRHPAAGETETRFGDPVDIDHFRTFQGTLGDRNFTYSGGDVNGGAKKLAIWRGNVSA